MTDSKKVLAEIVMSHDGPPEELAEYIGNEYQDVLRIKKKLQVITNRRNITHQQHRDELDSIELELRGIQHTCAHWLSTFYPDAAGGSDSLTECDICGVEL